MVKKNEPQRDASTGVDSQVAALAFQLRQLADHQLGYGNSIVHLDRPKPAKWTCRSSSWCELVHL
jgi:hypothetical protein